MTRWRVLLFALFALPLAACGDKTYNTTTVTISGPFEQCTVILLPSGRQVSFGESGVSVRDGNTITVNGITYAIDLSSCNAATSTTTIPPAS